MSGKRGEVFGIASSAVAIHGITAASAPSFSGASADLPNFTAVFFKQIEGHLNNMATAVTNENSILENIVEINASLTKITTNKFARIKKLLLEVKSAASYGTPTPVTGKAAASIDRDCVVSQILVLFKNKWFVGGFYSTHGWGVGPDHSSSSCRSNKPGHVDTAARENPSGPGANRNKSWDDFIK